MYVSAMEKIKADILAHGGFVAKETSSGLALIAGENNLENSKGLLPLPRVIEAAFVPQYRTPKITGKLGGIEQVWDHDFAPALEEFLKGFEDAPVKNVADLVQWNLANADRELPEGAAVILLSSLLPSGDRF